MTTILLSCKDNEVVKKNDFKTAYIDTAQLMDESQEAKDIEAKYKKKSTIMGDELEAEVKRFKSDAANFQKKAMEMGQAWAQQKGLELQQKEQKLTYAQQAMMQQLQEESGTEIDSLISKYRKVIKSYGKEKGFDYIYGTGETATVLYAKDNYDITKEVIKMVNDDYKPSEKNQIKPSN